MPVKRFKDVQEAEDAYADLERENIELKAAAKHSVGGFLSRNEKLVIGLITAILMALGGGGILSSLLNREEIKEAKFEAKSGQSEIIEKADAAAVNAKAASIKADEVYHEVKRKKGPFGE